MHLRRPIKRLKSWRSKEIFERILLTPSGYVLRLPKSIMKHPLLDGFRRDIGLPKGELANWRLGLKDGSCVHVREYVDCYAVHLDKVDPNVSLIEHLRKDLPDFYIAACAIAIGTIAWYIVPKLR